MLTLHLIRNYYKHRHEFKGTPYIYRWKVFLLHLHTYFGNQDDFWNPLFEKIAKHPPLKEGRGDEDDAIWNKIIPQGYEELQKIKRRFPNHAYPFIYPIPKCYKREPE